ncbi:cutinase-domain-containing protein [Eremomyces bilateralis CBS 781.70]|uniref:cutinase n=1 Tax=Eremomyces bilateralis CBS 781.70 TaxID=1392243 RepID=A0A6G1G7Q5_9PEZI|nr:cutinase-domain-containing protein [Eremomyces bilateralis CBS 781.70]KAF1814107.1 cutinase-domain-containing protein [Eremomyces bilateralis CBS 781.70]
MKVASILTLLAGIATAAPVAEPVEARQLFGVGMSASEFTEEGCKPVIFIFARGSTEPGNFGFIAGPNTANKLKDIFGKENVAAEGVDYPALLTTNFLPSGGDPTGVRDMKAKLQKATQCDGSIVVAGGYSQGAAITHEAIEDSPSQVVSRIAGVVTFGDTKKLQSRGKIQGIPPENFKIICAIGDLVCSGTLIITVAHLTYMVDGDDAGEFLAQRIRAAQSSGGSSGGSTGGFAESSNSGLGASGGGLFGGLFSGVGQ